MENKHCPHCNKTLPVSDFHKDRKKKDGLRSWCKQCVAKKFKENFFGSEHYQRRLRKYYEERKARMALTPKVQWITHAMGNAKGRAKRDGLDYTITRDDIMAVFPDTCPLLGIPFQFGKGVTVAGSPSLDRKNPLVGYTPENTWVISAMANRIKSNATTDQIEMVAQKLREYGV